MADIEPIVASWLVSPIGLAATGIVIVIVIVLVLSSLMNSYPSKE